MSSKSKGNRAPRISIKELKEKLAQRSSFVLSVPDLCFCCGKTFDKKSKEMAKTWKVIVREEAKLIHLYCPECWSLGLTKQKTEVAG